MGHLAKGWPAAFGLTRRQFITTIVSGGLGSALPEFGNAQQTPAELKSQLPVPQLSGGDSARGVDYILVEWIGGSSSEKYDVRCIWSEKSVSRELLFTESLPPVKIAGIPSNGVFKISVRPSDSDPSSLWSAELYTATRPPRPMPPRHYSLGMIQAGIRLEWDETSTLAKMLGASLARIRLRRELSDGTSEILASNLRVVDTVTDFPSGGVGSYRLAMETSNSAAPNGINVSEWSDLVTIQNSVFSELATPVPMEVKRHTPWFMRTYYGFR